MLRRVSSQIEKVEIEQVPHDRHADAGRGGRIRQHVYESAHLVGVAGKQIDIARHSVPEVGASECRPPPRWLGTRSWQARIKARIAGGTTRRSNSLGTPRFRERPLGGRQIEEPAPHFPRATQVGDEARPEVTNLVRCDEEPYKKGASKRRSKSISSPKSKRS